MHPLTLTLLTWYDAHARTLPWRMLGSAPHDPYTVWVSEIMLQQTTVATVLGYFPRFMQRFPTVHALAAASLNDVFVCWQGMGYYRRARMMHQCAQDLVAHHQGIFPSAYEDLIKLPGVGAYTAGAIRAIAFQKPALAIDGNVKRVAGRFLGVDLSTATPSAEALKTFLEPLVPDQRCGDFVQALMELGATLCMPRVALCSACPWQTACQTVQRGIALTPSRTGLKKPQRYGAVYIVSHPHKGILIEKRPPKGLLGGLYGLPTSSWESTPRQSWDTPSGAHGTWHAKPVTHVFTHFKLTLCVFVGTTADTETAPFPGIWVARARLDQYPMPTLFKKVLEQGFSGALGLA